MGRGCRWYPQPPAARPQNPGYRYLDEGRVGPATSVLQAGLHPSTVLRGCPVLDRWIWGILWGPVTRHHLRGSWPAQVRAILEGIGNRATCAENISDLWPQCCKAVVLALNYSELQVDQCGPAVLRDGSPKRQGHPTSCHHVKPSRGPRVTVHRQSPLFPRTGRSGRPER